MTPVDAEAKKPWWKIVGGLLATGGAVAAGLTGAGAGVVAPLCGVETVLLGSANGGGSGNGGGIPGGINDAQPYYSGPSLPEFCGGGTDCVADAAIRQAHLNPLPLPGTSPTIDNLTIAVNALMINPLKDHRWDGSSLDVVQADMIAMADQLDEVVFWLDALEVEDPSTRIEFTPQLIEQARQWMAVNGLPAEEVDIYLDAGLTMDQIDAIAAFHVDAMAEIELVGPPISMQDVLREAADSFRAMGAATTGTGRPTPGAAFALKQNTPNPFNPSTVIEYTANRPGSLSVRIYDVRGQVVKTLIEGNVPTGPGSVTWHGTDDRGQTVPPGTYFCRASGRGQDKTLKMTLMK